MAFTQAWSETTPDGSVITVSQLDDYQRNDKVAIRERMEGDTANPDLTGLIEVGSWSAAPKPRKGAARIYVDTAANIALFGATKREDGRLAVASDTLQLFHVATAAVASVKAVALDNQTTKFADGTQANPSITFNSQTGTGFRYIASNIIGISCAGVPMGEFRATGLVMGVASSIFLQTGKVLSVAGNDVIGDQLTGWGVPTGTLTRTTFVSDTVTLVELAKRVAALIADLHAAGTTTRGLLAT